mgnify:CR=1 FL=1
MKKKIILTILLGAVITYFIYQKFYHEETNIVTLGDSISLGMTPYNVEGYSFNDYLKDIYENNNLEEYITEFSSINETTETLLLKIQNNYTLESLKFIEENINNPKIVGIGEIGLDYYWVKDNKDKQIDLFIKQIELANKYNKTIVIHSRDAINDTYNILKEHLKTKAVMHCYSSSLEMAKKFIDLGIKLGIGGVLTFKNSKTLKEVVENIDIKNILLETDSPYLTPEPYRGKKNEPYNVLYVAKKIAEIKNIELEEVLEITSKTAKEQFDL